MGREFAVLVFWLFMVDLTIERKTPKAQIPNPFITALKKVLQNLILLRNDFLRLFGKLSLFYER